MQFSFRLNIGIHQQKIDNERAENIMPLFLVR